MLLIVALFCFLFACAALVVRPRLGVLATLAVKPVIDTTWRFALGPLKLTDLAGIALPLLIFFRSGAAPNRLRDMPLLRLWLFYIAYNLLTFTFLAVEGRPMASIELSTRFLYGFVGFYMMQAYFTDRESFRKLLVALLIAGLFPMLIGLYQAVTGVQWQERISVGLVRNVGLYHDVFAVRSLCMQTLTAIILFWTIFLGKRPRPIFKLALAAYAAVCLLVVYNGYSKAAVFIVAMWLMIWTLSRREFWRTLFIVAAGFVVAAVFGDQITEEIRQLFSKEITATLPGATELQEQRTLAGRWFGWTHLVDLYANSSVFVQLFGTGNNMNAHNDFLGRLMSGGLVGLMLYVIFLTVIGKRILRNWRRERSPLNVMALMIFAMWLVDCMGLNPSYYTTYQWYVWGFIGLALKGVDLRSESEAQLAPARKAPLLSQYASPEFIRERR